MQNFTASLYLAHTLGLPPESYMHNFFSFITSRVNGTRNKTIHGPYAYIRVFLKKLNA